MKGLPTQNLGIRGDIYTLDGSPARKPVEVGSLSTIIYMGFKNIQPVVGLGISEASTSINLQPIESPLIFAVTYNAFEPSTSYT